jgi:hypothetical protein
MGRLIADLVDGPHSRALTLQPAGPTVSDHSRTGAHNGAQPLFLH